MIVPKFKQQALIRELNRGETGSMFCMMVTVLRKTRMWTYFNISDTFTVKLYQTIFIFRMMWLYSGMYHESMCRPLWYITGQAVRYYAVIFISVWYRESIAFTYVWLPRLYYTSSADVVVHMRLSTRRSRVPSRLCYIDHGLYQTIFVIIIWYIL